MVIQNSQIHQRGSGLLYSPRSSSQAWPVVSASLPRHLALAHAPCSSTPQAMMLTSVMTPM